MKQLAEPMQVIPPVSGWNTCACDICQEVKREAQRMADLGILEGTIVLKVDVTIKHPALAKPARRRRP